MSHPSLRQRGGRILGKQVARGSHQCKDCSPTILRSKFAIASHSACRPHFNSLGLSPSPVPKRRRTISFLMHVSVTHRGKSLPKLTHHYNRWHVVTCGKNTSYGLTEINRRIPRQWQTQHRIHHVTWFYPQVWWWKVSFCRRWCTPVVGS